MKTYTVQELVKLAGVSVRTLHYYDEIGLLKPSRAENGYRQYAEPDVLLLQQILFYKELEVPLDAIKTIISRPNFTVINALREHKTKLKQKSVQVAKLLKTIDATLDRLTKQKAVQDEELFEAFWVKHETEYSTEAMVHWGQTDAYQQSIERTKHMTKADHKHLAQEGERFMEQLALLIDQGPTSSAVQTMIAQHYESLRTYYDPNPELYRNLGQMYVDDKRFGNYFRRFDERMPEFMRDTMKEYAKRMG